MVPGNLIVAIIFGVHSKPHNIVHRQLTGARLPAFAAGNAVPIIPGRVQQGKCNRVDFCFLHWGARRAEVLAHLFEVREVGNDRRHAVKAEQVPVVGAERLVGFAELGELRLLADTAGTRFHTDDAHIFFLRQRQQLLEFANL